MSSELPLFAPSQRYRALASHPLTHWLCSGLVLGVDYLCGPVVHFPIFFVLPVGTAAWFGHTRTSYTLAVIQPLARFVFRFFWAFTPWSLTVSAINLLIRATVLLLVAYLVTRVMRQARELRREVRILEGILPICSHCKRVRDQKLNWHQLEAYIANHSEADFTHGICPACLQEHYGEFLDDSPSEHGPSDR